MVGIVIPIEISVEIKRVQDFDPKENEKGRREDLDILEEKREIASIKEVHYTQKLECYITRMLKPYNSNQAAMCLIKQRLQSRISRKKGPNNGKELRDRKAYKLELTN
ncbi:hypothetical protein Tco_1094047 [Tanacetum coccineum]|uniref:Uncharacterized protein n=1 Tax=Tanacetum coccineum TaxID=301880 RepID=A0ABQ5IEF5_9ASTR